MSDDAEHDDGKLSLKDAWANYYTHTGYASSNARKLAFTGIALVWIFSGGGLISAEKVTIHGHYEWPLYLLIIALAVDLAQYVYLAIAWRRVAGKYDNDEKRGERFLAPKHTNLVAEVFWFAKVGLVSAGFLWLLIALRPKLIG